MSYKAVFFNVCSSACTALMMPTLAETEAALSAVNFEQKKIYLRRSHVHIQTERGTNDNKQHVPLVVVHLVPPRSHPASRDHDKPKSVQRRPFVERWTRAIKFEVTTQPKICRINNGKQGFFFVHLQPPVWPRFIQYFASWPSPSGSSEKMIYQERYILGCSFPTLSQVEPKWATRHNVVGSMTSKCPGFFFETAHTYTRSEKKNERCVVNKRS